MFRVESGQRRERRVVIASARPRIAVAVAIGLSVFASTQASAQLTGEINAHDPSSIIKSGSTYYYFATGDGLAARTSTDRVNWTAAPAVFSSTPGWIAASVPTYSGASLWAPDIVYRNNQYYLYYSASTFGTKRSGIGLAISPTLDRTAPNYGWVDQGAIVTSGNSSNFNAIDPAILQDSTTGKLWMTYGSFNTGIYVRELNTTTGKFLAGAPSVNVAAPGPTPEIEGASLVQHGGYYYLFANWGGCCSGIDSTYNIRVGRSTSPTGPFLDKNGVNMLSGGGTLFLDDDGARTGPGHFSIYSEGGQDQFSYHYYDGNRNGAPAFGLSNLFWTADQWPSVAAVNSDWTGVGTANWSLATNWAGGPVPNGVGQIANFVTASSGRYAVALDGGGKTASRVNFASPNGFTIGVVGGNALTLDAMAGDVQTTINASVGNHTINAPIVALDDLGVNVTLGASTLTLGGGVSGKTLVKYGHGTLALGGTQAYAGSLFIHAGSVVINGATTTTAFNAIGQIVGDNGTLTVQNAGSFSTTADLNVGDSGDAINPASGTLNLRDNAAITIGTTGGLYVGSGFFAGSRAVGTVNQSGGTLTANGNFDGAFVIGGRGSVNGVGTYNLSGGAVNANTNVFVGGRGTGTLTQTGGTFNASIFVSVGRFAGSTGTWTLTNGAVNQTNAGTALIVGEGGTGSLFIGAGGVVTSAGGVRLGLSTGSSGRVDLNAGGTLVTSTLVHGSGATSFNFDGGTLRFTTSSLEFFPFSTAESEIKAGGARIDTNGRTLRSTRVLDGVGGLTKEGTGTLTFTQAQAFTGGVTVNAGTLFVPRLNNNGGLTLNAGVLDLTAPTTPFDPAQRSVITSLTQTGGGTLDIDRNLLVIDYASGAGATQLTTVRSMLAQGTLLSGVTPTAGTAIGYVDTATLTPTPTAFGTVDASAVLVRLTLTGDANLDAAVTFDDLLALARNYGSVASPKTWQDGDFDYNASVDFDDLLTLARNYGMALSASQAQTVAAASDSTTFAADWALATSLVPEPSVALALVGAGALGGVRRRR